MLARLPDGVTLSDSRSLFHLGCAKNRKPHTVLYNTYIYNCISNQSCGALYLTEWLTYHWGLSGFTSCVLEHAEQWETPYSTTCMGGVHQQSTVLGPLSDWLTHHQGLVHHVFLLYFRKRRQIERRSRAKPQ